jgi:hypothetical protein
VKNSFKVLLSFYQFSCAYELQYSFHVTILTCRTLYLIIHIIYMIRSRAKLRWWFVIHSGLPMSYACRSIGSESQVDMGSFFVHGQDALVHGNLCVQWCCTVEG